MKQSLNSVIGLMSKLLAMAEAWVMRSAEALESKRAQASVFINDNISHSLSADDLCQWINIQQSKWHSIMFLPCWEICSRWVWMILGKGGNTGLLGLYLLLPTHFDFLCFTYFKGVTPSESPSFQSILTGLSLQVPAGTCWSLQVPMRCLKIQGQTFHIPHYGVNVPSCYT